MLCKLCKWMKGKEKTAEVNVGKIRHAVVKLIRFLLNPRLLLCLGLGWMTVVSGSYLAFLWVPFTPEKIVTIAIAIVLLRRLFPKDEKTLAVLIEAYHKAKVKLGRRRRRDRYDLDRYRRGNQKLSGIVQK